MPLDHGGWLHQHHRVDDLRPNPVEPHPQEPIQGGKLGPTGTLSPQDGHLMSGHSNSTEARPRKRKAKIETTAGKSPP